MNVRQWLGRARSLDQELTALEEQKRIAIEAATRITQNYSGDGAQRTPDPHKFDRIAEYIGLLDAKHDELIDVKREIAEAIYRLEDGRHRTILLEYYINCLSWEEVAAKTHYSWRNTMYLRKAALREMEKVCIELHIVSVV